MRRQISGFKKTFFLPLLYLFGALLISYLLPSCQKEISSEVGRTDSTTAPADSIDRWVLNRIRFSDYDTLTGQRVDSTSYVDSILYMPVVREVIILREGYQYLKLAYTPDSLLSVISWFENNTWPETFRFQRNSMNQLQEMRYSYWSKTGTGHIKSTTNAAGKQLQYIDTLDSGPSSEGEFYTVQYDHSGKVISKKYAVDASGTYYSDWTSPRGEHYYTYDANGGLSTVLWVEPAGFSGTTNDTLKASYRRDIRGNNLLRNYFTNFYGKDLSFWFTKYKFFSDNLVNSGSYTVAGGWIESFYNFGKPCMKVILDKIRYYPDVLGGPEVRHLTTQVILYNNVFDSKGNLTAYTATMNGKVLEKWEFGYKKL